MRSPSDLRRLSPLLLAALLGCGDYSTEDLRFLVALPTRDDLRVSVPAQAEARAGLLSATACGEGVAEVWLWAEPTSANLNGLVEFVVGLVDAVRRQPPTHRARDARGWGPWDDERHPGVELRAFVAREWPDGEEGAPTHAYALQARRKRGGADWTTVLAGTFEGASASRGRGELLLVFDALWGLGMNDADTPRGTAFARYDRAAEPATTELVLAEDGFGVVRFAYQHARWEDGRGWFAYAVPNERGDLFYVGAGFDATGAGDAAIGFRAAGGLEAGFRQCWDDGACLVHVADPLNVSCATPPCSLGSASACPAVPGNPFPPG